ncbi:MAG: hypothetical protein RSA79_07365, partial [Oscillospiraceae bacterium]
MIKTLSEKLKLVTPKMIFGTLFCLSVIGSITQLAFSVRTFYAQIITILMFFSFAFSVFVDVKQNSINTKIHIKHIYNSAKWLFIALFAYFVWDIITMFYTKDISLALRKLPYLILYLMITASGIYYIIDKKTFIQFISSVAVSGGIVALFAYLHYFFSMKPMYFQRLSTASDYNVFSTVIMISFIFMTQLLLNYSKTLFLRRILLFVLVSLVNLPLIYLTGSRRMIIMMPYFFAFSLGYEVIRYIVSYSRKKRYKDDSTLIQHILVFSTLFLVYLVAMAALPVFSEYGAKKEAAYKQWRDAQIAQGIMYEEDFPELENNAKPEGTIKDAMDTIENKSMYGKRNAIYDSAFRELKKYTVVDAIFGRGAAYDMYYFDHTEDKALLEAYEIESVEEKPSGWMYVHNFMLSDLMNGGIIKLLLGIFVVVQIIIHIVKAIIVKKRSGALLVVAFSLVLINN